MKEQCNTQNHKKIVQLLYILNKFVSFSKFSHTFLTWELVLFFFIQMNLVLKFSGTCLEVLKFDLTSDLWESTSHLPTGISSIHLLVLGGNS